MAGLIGLMLIFAAMGCLSNHAAPSVLPPERTIPAPVVSPTQPLLPLVPPGAQLPVIVPMDGSVIQPTSNTIPEFSGGPASGSVDPNVEASRPKLGDIYGRSAQSADEERNPLIVIPGVLGSRLVDDASRRVVWGEFGGDGIDPSSPNGARLLALPMAEGRPLNQLTDSVHVQGVLDALEIRVFGVPFEMNAYRDILVALGVGGYRESASSPNDINYGGINHNSFQFAYDWRRDNVENAQRLHQFIIGKKAEIEAARRKRFGDAAKPVKFDIVAHSMGGLIARYYVQYGDADLPPDGSLPPLTWAGTENVERVVLVGTPNAGSIDAVENMIKGVVFSQALPRYQSGVLGTMPGLYQLLPRSRHRPVISEADRKSVDIMDVQTWVHYRWGLMNPDQQYVLRQLLPNVNDPAQQQRIAYDHLKKCLDRARSFHAALDVRSKPPAGTSVHLIAGDAYPTSAQLWVRSDGHVSVASRLPGDGKVTRASALMDERYAEGSKWSPRLVSPITWSSVNFLFTDHLGLTRDPAFTDNVLYLLLEAPR
jgi:pimeloyl-ACP methyl ester carboxylesterase